VAHKQVWTIQLSQQAELDFSEILKWTAKNFGMKQANNYAETLWLAIGALNAGPEIVGSRNRDELGSGICTLHVARNRRRGRHFVVFRAAENQTIAVLRLLHDSMDLARHVPG
jgi:toxin ParE1/3/4